MLFVSTHGVSDKVVLCISSGIDKLGLSFEQISKQIQTRLEQLNYSTVTENSSTVNENKVVIRSII